MYLWVKYRYREIPEVTMKNLAKAALCLLLAGMVLFAASCGGSGSKQSAADAVAAYQQALKDGRPIFVDFYSPG